MKTNITRSIAILFIAGLSFASCKKTSDTANSNGSLTADDNGGYATDFAKWNP